MLALICLFAQILSKKIDLEITTTSVVIYNQSGYQDVYYEISLQSDNGVLLEESNVKIVLFFTTQRTLISNNWIVYSANGKVTGKVAACCNSATSLEAEADGYTTGISEAFSKSYANCFHFHPQNLNTITQFIDNEVSIDYYLINPISNFSLSFLEISGNQVASYRIGTHDSTQLKLYLTFETIFEKKLFITYGDYHTTWVSLKIICNYKHDVTFPDGYPLYANIPFSLSVAVLSYLTGEKSNSGTSYSVEITSTPENSISGTTIINTINDEAIFENLIITQAGDYVIKAKTKGLCEGYIDLTVSPPLALKATLISNSFLSTISVFNVKVEICNSDFSTKVTKYILPLDIKLDSNEKISGTTSTDSVDGEWLFTSLSIHTEGTYIIIAYSSKCTEGKTEEFVIHGLYLKIYLDSDPPIDTNDYFTICVEVYLESDFLTLSIYEEYLVTLTPVPDSIIEGNLIENTVNGVILFSNLRFLDSSIVSFTASSPYASPSSSLELQVKIQYISVTFPNIIPKNTLSIFDLLIQIYDDKEFTVLCEESNLLIEINLETLKGEIVETENKMTIEGQVIIEDINIKTQNQYLYTATGIGLISGKSIEFEIKDIYFDWNLTITEENTVIIEFEEQLLSKLSSTDINIELVDELKCEFKLRNEDYSDIYIFDIIAGETIPEKTQITVNIIKENIISINDHFLNNTEKTGELNLYEYKCPSSDYFDVLLKLCKTCLSPCIECESSIICTKCIENSYLTISKVCDCNLGYSGDICSRNYFHSSIFISSTNQISISFSEPLSEPLMLNDFEAFINLEKTNVNISSQTSKTLNLALDPNQEIEKGSIFTFVYIKNNVTSEYNSLISNKELKGFIYEHKLINISDEYVNILENLGINAPLASSIIFITGSIVISDPVVLGNYINTIEYFYCFYYFGLDIHKTLKIFLRELRAQSQTQNFFHIFFSASDKKKTSQLYDEIGYHSNLVILNAGWNVTILLILLFLLITCSLLKKFFRILNSKFNTFIELFYYNAFLRYWLISYFEIGISSIIAIKFCIYNLTGQIVNASIGCLFLTCQFFMAVLVVCLVFKRNIIGNGKKVEFLKKYGTLFNEFYERGISDWFYYSIMILRKISLMVLSTVNAPQNIAICISFLFSFGNFVYVWSVKPFKMRLLILYNISIELSIIILHIVIFITHNNLADFSKRKSAYICIWVIVAGWLLNGLYLILLVITKVKEYIRSRRVHVKIAAIETYPQSTITEVNKDGNNDEILFYKRQK
ncbi:hypothetical protein SteCoe_21481 [Stentor coeruleus]|uniref:EGF-like domain-containing protein n=1 Tax=Stentor coeruleus TaxID=5963 RepID=A0A1R2BPL0_9CILI|nr:hypothetical protein SteCoe_21481 [Stentor coeruleus]